VTDVNTGLIWLKQGNCLPASTWPAANQAAAGLKDGDCGLTDGSSPGDWRLPTLAEWSGMVKAGCNSEGNPAIRDDRGLYCYGSFETTSPFTAGATDYWSSTGVDEGPGWAWMAELFPGTGRVGVGSRSVDRSVWPVRSGTR
jgi:hypothetical protein